MPLSVNRCQRSGLFLCIDFTRQGRLSLFCIDVLAVSSSSSVHPIRISGAITMSQTASASSSNFRTIFVAAIRAYEKKTKTDLLTHPLATQLQSCSSSSDILAVLHDKVHDFDQSRSDNERLSSWLNPTINVLYAFSATLGGGVGLVSSTE
jgi:hypothetical protein